MSTFIFTFLGIFSSIFLVLMVFGNTHGKGLTTTIAASASIALVGSLASLFISNKLGALFSRLILDIHETRWGRQKRLFSDFEKARRIKKEQRFEEALKILDRILEQEPLFPDALCLKAQILWEGFGDSTTSKMYLKKLMQEVPKDQNLYRWASGYYDEIRGLEKIQQSNQRPGQ